MFTNRKSAFSGTVMSYSRRSVRDILFVPPSSHPAKCLLHVGYHRRSGGAARERSRRVRRRRTRGQRDESEPSAA